MAFGEIGSAGDGQVGAAYVTIGADLGPLRAAEEEVKATLARIGGMSAGNGGGFASPNLGTSFGSIGTVTPGSSGVMNIGVNPNMGTIGGTFLNNPNLGGTIGASFGGLEQSIAQATQTAVQGAITNVQRQVAAAVEQYAASMGGGSLAGMSVLGTNVTGTFSTTQAGHIPGFIPQANPYVIDAGVAAGGFGTSRINGALPSQFGFVSSPISTVQEGYHGSTNVVNGSFGLTVNGAAPAQPPMMRPFSTVQEGYGEGLTGRDIANFIRYGNDYSWRNAPLPAPLPDDHPARRGSRIFGMRGWLSEQTGIPYIGELAAAYAIHIGGNFAHAYEEIGYAGEHPELTANRLGRLGSGLGLTRSPLIGGLSREYDALSGSLAVRGAVNSLPLLGAFDVGSDSSFAMRQRQGRISEIAENAAYFGQLGYSIGGMRAGLTGDTAGAYGQSMAQRIAEAQERADQFAAQAHTAGGQLLNTFGQAYREGRFGGNTGQFRGLLEQTGQEATQYQNVSNAARDAAGALNELKATVSSTASAIASRQASAINVTNANAMANVVLGGGGNPQTAMTIRQQAEGMAAANDFLQTPIFSSAGVINATGLAQSWANMGSVAAGQLRETGEYNRSIADVPYGHVAASLTAGGAYFGSQVARARGQIATMLDTPGRGLAQAELNAQIEDMGRRNSISAGLIGASAEAADLRAQRRPYEASVREANARYRAQQQSLDLSEPGAAGVYFANMRAHGANLREMAASHANDLQLESEGYGAQVAEAGEIMALRPVSAGAVGAVAQARRMVELSSPENRDKAIAAGRASLRAAAFETTAQRGGYTAIDMSVSQALGAMYGSGIDLTGRKADIGRAQNLYQTGANDLDTAKLTGSTGAVPPQMVEDVKTLVKFVQQLLTDSPILGLFKK